MKQELSAEQEDFLIESGMERTRELRDVEDMQEDEIDEAQECRADLIRKYDEVTIED